MWYVWLWCEKEIGEEKSRRGDRKMKKVGWRGERRGEERRGEERRELSTCSSLF